MLLTAKVLGEYHAVATGVEPIKRQSVELFFAEGVVVPSRSCTVLTI